MALLESAYAKSITHPLHFVKRIRKISRAIRLWQFPQTFFPLLKTVFQRGVFPQCCGKLWKTTVLGVYIPQNPGFSAFPHKISPFQSGFFSTPCGKHIWKTPAFSNSVAFSTPVFNSMGKTTHNPMGKSPYFSPHGSFGQNVRPGGIPTGVFSLESFEILLQSGCVCDILYAAYQRICK